jgi:hypothetical protein
LSAGVKSKTTCATTRLRRGSAHQVARSGGRRQRTHIREFFQIGAEAAEGHNEAEASNRPKACWKKKCV